MISNVAVIFKVNNIFHSTVESVLYIWDKVFKNGLSKICEDRLQKIWNGLPKQTISLQIVYKSCLPQILLGPFLNTLSLVPFCGVGA